MAAQPVLLLAMDETLLCEVSLIFTPTASLASCVKIQLIPCWQHPSIRGFIIYVLYTNLHLYIYSLSIWSSLHFFGWSQQDLAIFQENVEPSAGVSEKVSFAITIKLLHKRIYPNMRRETTELQKLIQWSLKIPPSAQIVTVMYTLNSIIFSGAWPPSWILAFMTPLAWHFLI